MADEHRPTGLGWPTDQPRATDQPRTTGQGRLTDQGRAASEERSVWSLSREDQRLLWITFAGGVASFIVGAVIIGGAIALVRAAHVSGLGWLAVVTGIFGVLSLLGIKQAQRWPGLPPALRASRRYAWIYWTGPVATWLVFGAMILIWIGTASGIK
jgi:hypothetical protein